MKPRLFIFILSFTYIISPFLAKAQCLLSIGSLPDTIRACRNSQVQLNATLLSATTAVPTDTLWSPYTGLSDTNILNPIATIGTTSMQYTLSVSSITAQNFVYNGDFSLGNTGFTSQYIDTNGPGSLWPEGYYSVVSNPNSVHPNFAAFGDHTTSTGLMMVINGASTRWTYGARQLALRPIPNTIFLPGARLARPATRHNYNLK